MSNFFSNANNNDLNNNLFSKSNEEVRVSEENSLNNQYNDLKNNYEQIFIEAAESIRRELDKIKPEGACENCTNKDCKLEKKDIFSPYPISNCKLREWQMKAITYLNGDYRTKLKAEYKSIMDKKNNYECNKCGACCKLAVSEYSYEQLKQRAHKGDKYSEDFISVFIPYESEEEAKAVNPEYFELLNILVEDSKIYYYHCPKLGKDNLCTIYDKRPDICRDFPYNPLKLLPSECSFNEWKNELSHLAMLLKAKTDIISFYKEKLG